MPDFEAIIKFLVLFGGFMGIIVAAGFGFKRVGQKAAPDPDTAERLRDVESRIGELEERLDFSERALAEYRARTQIPPVP